MSEFNFLKDLQEKVYCRLAASKIHGVGVVAIRPIPKGINPMEESRKSEFVEISSDDMTAGVPEFAKQLVKDFCPEIVEDREWDTPAFSLNEIGISWYLNHSATPNMEERDGYFFSIRDIETGEELTVDYDTYGALNL